MVELRSDEASQSGPVRPALSRGCHALAPRVHRDQIAIARRPPTQPPARSFTGGFRTTAAVQAEASRWAVIRTPYMSAKLSRPFPHGFDRRSYPFVLPLLQSPSFRPDPQYLNAV